MSKESVNQLLSLVTVIIMYNAVNCIDSTVSCLFKPKINK